MRQRHRPPPAACVINLSPPLQGAGDAARRKATVEVPFLGIVPDQEHQLDIGQLFQNKRVPGFRAFPPGRKVAALGIDSGKAKSHGNDGDRSRIVEDLLVEPEPAAKAHTGWVSVRPARRVSPRARRLADDADARIRRRLDHRPGIVRQADSIARRIAAHRASANTLDEAIKFRGHVPGPKRRPSATDAVVMTGSLSRVAIRASADTFARNSANLNSMLGRRRHGLTQKFADGALSPD